MLLLKSAILSALDDYGIRDITSSNPVVGLDGIIKDAAIFVSTNFDFKGIKSDPTSIYAFPRDEVNEDNPLNYTPECVNEAMMLYVIESLRNCNTGRNPVSAFGAGTVNTRIGRVWDERELSTNPLYISMLAIMEPVLKNEGLQTFDIEDF